MAGRSCITMPTHDRASGRWQALLSVDETDPVFFDHYVDHVPGMLMLQAIAELAEHASRDSNCAASVFDLSFARFVEKGLPAQLAITGGTDQAWQVEMTQAGEVVCAGMAATIKTSESPEAARGVPESVSQELADAVLVHRKRPENIVISAMRHESDRFSCDYVPSAAGPAKGSGPFHPPLDVVEAARQFMIMLTHTACGFDLDRHLILNQLTIHMPQTFARQLPVRLFADQPTVNRTQIDFSISAHCSGAQVATIGWAIKAVPPAVYVRVRGSIHE